MNSEKHGRPSDDELDALFRSARFEPPSCVDNAGGFERIEFGFETRLLARLREERGTSWLAWAWRLCPFAAALAIAASAWSYTHGDDAPDTESVYAAVRLAGMPVLDYYLGREE
jgi:hypothetical protein